VDDIHRLAQLISQRNSIDADFSALIGRPATQGHIGEFIASRIFDIQLMDSATNKVIDGHFRSGPLAGKSVDIKLYGKQEAIFDVSQAGQPDYLLVLTGPVVQPSSSRGQSRLLVINHVYLFNGPELAADIRRRGVKSGVATSVPSRLWEAAEIYPTQRSAYLALTSSQRSLIELFAATADP
jgi:hypothetical protein